MTSSQSFPDVNVWMAFLSADHEHHKVALKWFAEGMDQIVFSRITQISVLRLMTTPAAMGGKPFSMLQAWATYDRLFDDPRVTFVPEPSSINRRFREFSSKKSV